MQSCLQWVSTVPSSASGLYYVSHASVAAYQVYCQMSWSPPGWTLIMRIISSNFGWGHNAWTSSATEDPSNFNFQSGTGPQRSKYPSFNYVSFSAMRSADLGMSTYLDQSTSGSSALALFSQTSTPYYTGSYQNYFSDRASGFSLNNLNDVYYGLNLYWALSNCFYYNTGSCDWNGGARWGIRVCASGSADFLGVGWGAYGCFHGNSEPTDTVGLFPWDQLMFVR